jgi:hypothetical protein
MSSKGKITNKNGKGIIITKKINALVHIEYGMKISSYHDMKTYAK